MSLVHVLWKRTYIYFLLRGAFIITLARCHRITSSCFCLGKICLFTLISYKRNLMHLFMNRRLEDEINSPLPLTLAPLSLPRELLCTFPDVGTILLIIADPALVKSQLDVLNSGKWVKIVNLHFEVHAGLWCGIFMPQTRLRYTPNEDSLIIKRQRWLLNYLNYMVWIFYVGELKFLHILYIHVAPGCIKSGCSCNQEECLFHAACLILYLSQVFYLCCTMSLWSKSLTSIIFIQICLLFSWDTKYSLS